MLHDSTIAKGKEVPETKLRSGKKTNLITTKIKIKENAHPLKLLSFQSKNQNLLKNFLMPEAVFASSIRIIAKFHL